MIPGMMLMDRIMGHFIIFAISLCGFISCVEYTPKPRGYARIEPPVASYTHLMVDSLPFSFDLSDIVEVELPGSLSGPSLNMKISYPSLKAKLYCSYNHVGHASLDELLMESRSIVARQMAVGEVLQERAYGDPNSALYCSLFELGGGAATPIQFILTDSVSSIFRAALYFDCKPNADSLAPAVDYIREDIIEMIQTFRWRR